MDKTGSQKFLKVISIIDIVLAVIGIIVSLITFAGGAGLSAVAESSSEVYGGALLIGVGFVALIYCVFELIVGILGLRGANDPAKIGPFWVICIIAVIFGIIGLIMGIVEGADASGVSSYIIELIINLIMLWVANNIKKLNA